MLNKKIEQGFTITELLVGLVVGLIVVGGVISVYISTLKTSSATLQSSRLNQEMGAILNIMVNDIRRAGYWGDVDLVAPETNPFNQVVTATPANTSALRVHSTTDNGVTYVDRTEEATLTNRTGSCIIYTYDVSQDGVLDSSERFGFRWNGQASDTLMMRTGTATGANDCNSSGWQSVTDTGSIEITTLTFSLANSKCLNATEPDGVDEDGGGVVDEFNEFNCYLAAYAPDAGERTMETFQVNITLEANLADDPSVTASMTQSVQVRNYLVRVY